MQACLNLNQTVKPNKLFFFQFFILIFNFALYYWFHKRKKSQTIMNIFFLFLCVSFCILYLFVELLKYS